MMPRGATKVVTGNVRVCGALSAAQRVLLRSLANKGTCEWKLGRTSAAVATFVSALRETACWELPVDLVGYIMRKLVAAAMPFSQDDAVVVRAVMHRLKTADGLPPQLESSLQALLPPSHSG
jgi:hypothetical protein